MLIVGIIQWQFAFAKNNAMVGETDSFYRLLAVQEYLKSGGSVLSSFVKLPLGGVWLSGYFSMFILLGKIGFNEIGFRTFTWMCGLFLVLLIWLISNKLTKKVDVLAWVVVLFIFIMSPLMMQVNFEMLGEPIIGFLLLLSLFFLLRENKIWTILFLFLAQSVRYEAWFMIPFYWIYILCFNKDWSWKSKIMMFLGTILFPLFWLVLNQIQNGSFLFFYTTRQFFLGVSPYSGNFFISLKEWTLRLQQYASIEWFILWIFGLIFIFHGKFKKGKWWAALSIYSFLIVVIQLWLNATEWFAPRYIYLVYIFSIPVILMATNTIKRIYRKTNIMGKIILIVIFVMLANRYITGIPTIKKNVDLYFIPNQEIKILTEKFNSKVTVSDKKTIYLLLKISPWLASDFSYYLENRNGWAETISLESNDELNKINKGEFLIAEKGLIKDGKEFSKIAIENYIFEVWLRN